mmetsp:Transcript_56717/g.122091  ORF Transcript_56717/g.122091 Transcript_56717/m.122091 type:complete len:257 (+) Transcript_56717:56-826(+)
MSCTNPVLVAPASTTGGATAAGPRLLRLARDLTAKRAVERHLGPSRARGPRRPRGNSRALEGTTSHFCRLPCCAENEQLQEVFEVAERRLGRQSLDLLGSSWAVGEEVQQLSAEVQWLRQGACGADRAEVEALALERQVEARRADVLEAQRAQQEAEARRQRLAAAVAEAEAQAVCSEGAAVVDARQAELVLLRRCVDLHEPASRALSGLGCTSLPELPAQGAMEPAAHFQWIGALTTEMAGLCRQIQSLQEDGKC